MNNTLPIDYHDPRQIRSAGIEALTKALGPVGMAYFMRQFEKGSGDYTAEREELLADLSMDDILQGALEMEQLILTRPATEDDEEPQVAITMEDYRRWLAMKNQKAEE